MDKRYQVFVSSTFTDLKEERAKVSQAVMELDCFPAGMELFPAIDVEQLEFIKKVIDDCDYYLLIIEGRYGSVSEGGLSYTEMEYDYAISKEIKAIVFIHQHPEAIPFGKSEQEAGLRTKLDAFRNKASTGRLVKYWNNADELAGLVTTSLSKTIKIYPAIGWVRADATTINLAVAEELARLSKENSELNEQIKKLTNADDLATLARELTETTYDFTINNEIRTLQLADIFMTICMPDENLGLEIVNQLVRQHGGESFRKIRSKLILFDLLHTERSGNREEIKMTSKGKQLYLILDKART
ncbi:hypothetical protein SAMN00120144_4278 [Hymenobacter roseosalivarius DSM 11622]|uniref:DUF4062 domain-containing protein n=1 Tax=Hymenobacter roseosalivarius DSM 11622 TaxID=645990 RepID=A0A1W1UK36_9BACT|nr:DUF4062 domain-containing protein [Hymenobacter roseosalivarius]SMB81399.1 hypothetical protein SAMN00120144_4278 [Hymenobacter roseosalivarius DSM 11622]